MEQTLQPHVTSRAQARVVAIALTAVATIAGLIASAILLVDYSRPAVFCADGGGCDRLKATTFAAWAGVPTPAIGLVGFAILGALALFPGPRARLGHLVLAASAAAFGAFLLAVQTKLSVFCRFCVVVDVAALVLFVGAAMRFRLAVDAPGRRASAGFATAMAIAAAAPLGFGFSRPLPPPTAQGPVVVPDVVKREIAATPPAMVTVVDFADFECPFCRLTHEALTAAMAKHGDRVRVVRKHVPLKSIHPGALPAALAACCGEKMAKGEPMADALFTVPESELTTQGCEAIASRLGLDVAAFRACVADPATLARVERDTAEFRASGGRGLPVIWVDEERLVGAQDAADLDAAIQRALKRRS